MAHNLRNRLWQSFLELNVFTKSSSDAQTIPKERLTTRIYICALFGFLLAITIVAALVVRSLEKTEYSPSYTKFLQLMHKYPNTLYCPCSNFGITYNTFVTTQVDFHQVCSSQLIQQTWIDLIFTRNNISFWSIDDYRVTLSFFWQTIAGLCVASNRTWTDAQNNFGASSILAPTAVADKVVQSTVQAALTNQIAVSQASLTRNLLAIRRMTSGSQIVSGLQTNYYLRYPPEDLGLWNSPKMSPRVFDDCSCLNIEGCPRPATFQDNHEHLITIPGMIADCLIIDGVLASTLECYYNQTCLSLLHESLPTNIQPLSSSFNNYFSVNSTVQMLLNEIMIDKMTSEIQFDVFYTKCNPAYCSYSYTHRFDVLFVITTIIGIFGSLSLALRLIAPFITAAVLRWQCRGLANDNMSNERLPRENHLRIVWNRIRRLPNTIREAIMNLNLFESQRLRTPIQIYREQLLTRLFIVLIILSSITVGLYIFLVEQNQVVTITHPSLATYQQLYNEHPDTLKCPCSQLSVSYKAFLNVTFVLHQVCQSDLVSPIWLTYLASFDPTLVLPSTDTEYSRDFRTIGASYFQLLTTFCSLVRINIEDAQRVFTGTQFVNDRVMAPTLFVRETEAIIESFIDRTRDEFVRIFDWINMAFGSSQFFNGANINFNITSIDDDQLSVEFPLLWVLVSISDTGLGFTGPCSCALDLLRGCYIVPELYTNGSYLNESGQYLFYKILNIGCIPLIGFSNSKISWWYNATYFEYIQATYSLVIDSQTPPHIMPLSASQTTQFGDVDTIDLIREMMLETSTKNNTYFDQFYYECAPSSCTYTIVRRREIIVILFLLIAICGGLNKGLKILIPLIGKSIFFCIDQWKNRHVQQEQPATSIRLKHLVSVIYQSIKALNLFETTATDETNIHQQRTYTRIYLFLFVSCLSVILFYTAILERTITKTYLVPSIQDYEQLTELYSHDVTCPCTHVSISYSEFVIALQVNAFHDACATGAVNKIFTSGASINSGMVLTSTNDFTSWIPFFIISIENLCTLAKETVNNSIATFGSSTIFINQLMTHIQFINEINETLNRFEKETPVKFARTLDLIRTTAQGNALMAMFSSNWNFVVGEKNEGKNASFLNIPVVHFDGDQNITCSCATLRTCTIPVKVSIFDGLTILDGLVFGCTLLETTLLSSFSCLYSDTCINNVRLLLNADYVLPENSVKLNASSTRFSINGTVETMAYEMFIESWTNNVSYERFFNSCAPSHCTFIYHYRFDALELLTTFLTVFAGLSLALRFVVPFLTKMVKNIRNRLRIVPLQ